MKQVIVFHDGCPDGWGSAWWLGKHLGEHIKHPGRYGEDPPLELCKRADVWLVDFCYEPAELTALADACKTLTIFDHHQTAVGHVEAAGFTMTPTMIGFVELFQLGGHAKVAGVLDMDRSGVGLVSEFVRYQFAVNAPDFLGNIEDRDLWRFNLPDTKDVFAAVTARPYTVEAWDKIEATYYFDLVREGEAINLYRDRLIEQVAASTFVVRLRGGSGPAIHARCATSPYAVGSDVAGEIAKRPVPHPSWPHGIGAYAILHEDCVQVGLRSREDLNAHHEGPDVAEIAERYGGGGHKHASGFKVTWDEWRVMTGG